MEIIKERSSLTVNKVAGILTNLSKWNGECDLLVQVDGKDRRVKVIESEDYKPARFKRSVRILLEDG